MWENAQKTCSRRVISIREFFLGGWDASPPSQSSLILPKIAHIGQNVSAPGERGGIPTPPKKSLILITLLEHVFGAFSHINPSEPFHLGIAHF